MLKNVSNAIVSQGLPKMSFGEEFSLREKEYLQKLLEGGKKNKCPNRSMEAKLLAVLGNYDRPTNHPTDRQTTYRPGHRKVSLPITIMITSQRTDARIYLLGSFANHISSNKLMSTPHKGRNVNSRLQSTKRSKRKSQSTLLSFFL